MDRPHHRCCCQPLDPRLGSPAQMRKVVKAMGLHGHKLRAFRAHASLSDSSTGAHGRMRGGACACASYLSKLKTSCFTTCRSRWRSWCMPQILTCSCRRNDQPPGTCGKCRKARLGGRT